MSSDSTERREAAFRRHWWGYGVGLVVLYAFAGPLLRFAYPGDLWLVGLLFACILYAGYWSMLYNDGWDGKVMLLTALVALVLAGLVASPVMNASLSDSRANDRRCLAIQRDMLSSMPLRSDGPDLFQALGCRPQGDGNVYAERETKGNREALIEQDARRSKLPYRNPYPPRGGGARLRR